MNVFATRALCSRSRSTVQHLLQQAPRVSGGFSLQAAQPFRAFSKLAFTNEGDRLSLSFEDGKSSSFHHIWLRDHCRCRECVHESSGQKMNNILQYPEDIHITNVGVEGDTLVCDYSDDHRGTIEIDWLRDNCYDNSSRDQRRAQLASLHTWQGDAINPTRHDYAAFTTDDKVKLAVMEDINSLGFAWLKNVPGNDGEVVKCAQRVTPIIRETFYGRYWDVISKPNNVAENVAYTSLMLFAHMDLMYFEAPPGLQLLHAKEFTIPEEAGGETFWVDAFRCVQELRETDPEAFEILKRVPVTHHFQDEADGQSRMYKRPIINEDDNLYGSLKIFFSPPWFGPLEVDPEDVEPFYKALRTFTSIVHSSRPYTTRIHQGECVIFNNRRLLHGRNSFDASSGIRHLQGTYVDLDDFYNDLCVLTERLKTK